MRVDRAAHRRDGSGLASAFAVLVAGGGVVAGDNGLVLAPPGSWETDDLICYLGQYEGADYVAVRNDGQDAVPLRPLLGRLKADPDGLRDRELATTAVAMAHWHASHLHCPRCGGPTVARSDGWERHCPACDRAVYPRTDPAVIVAITDPHDRLLLAHASAWSPRRYSHLAGYVEPGESLEQAAHREITEESGLRLAGLAYVGSQPWPFPASMMVGFRASVEDTSLRLDMDEITDARWVSRPELDRAIEAGEVIIAPRGSIARTMLEQWHGDGDRLTALQRD